MTNDEIKEALHNLSRAFTTYVNMGLAPRINVVKRPTKYWWETFLEWNPLIFLGSMVEEDPQEFLDELYKIVHAMGVTSRDKDV